VPSSLVFTALVVAWLAVLVPVVARRRQMVPQPAEAHLNSRVLTRPERSAASVATVITAAPQRVGAGMRDTADADDAADAADTTDGADTVDPADTDAAGADAPEGRVLDRGRGRRPFRDDAGEDEGMDDRDEGRLATEAHDDEFDDGYTGDDAHRRSYRPGRGGFDADAAAAAAHARYTFRQRVAVGLIAIAVLSLLAALVVTPVLWWLHVVTDLGLVGYLVFLRRQTRIEDELRRRRLARLTGERRALEARRDRQAEHEARLAQVPQWGAADGVDEDHGFDDGRDGPAGYDDHEEHDDLDDLDVPAPRWVAPRAPAPAVPDGMELVADSEEHPDFHDLSDSRVPAYRRVAAGA
jgi:hypothetical protein